MKIQVDVPVPRWLITVGKTLKYARLSLGWILKPERCSECSSVMPSKWLHYSITTPSRLMAENSKSGICSTCLGVKVAVVDKPLGLFGDKLRSYDKKDKCDCCGEEKESYKFYSDGKDLDLRLCGVAWNCGYYCKSCILSAVLGKPRTNLSSYNYHTKRFHDVNNRGLFLDENGKVMLFCVVR